MTTLRRLCVTGRVASRRSGRWLACLISLVLPTAAIAADDGPAYRTPSAPVVRALEAPPRPLAFAGPNGTYVALLSRAALPPIEDLASPVLGLAGAVIDPANNGPARGLKFDSIRLLSVSGGDIEVALPAGARISTPRWAPDGRAFAFIVHAPASIDLWTADPVDGSITKVATGLNAGFPEPFVWLPDSSGFLMRLVPAGRPAPPERPAVPIGPEIQESGEQPVAVQTLANVLGNRHDEDLFRHFFTSQLAIVVEPGAPPELLGISGLFHSMSVSPDGRFILAERLKEPFSRSFGASAFPADLLVLDRTGATVRQVADRPGAEAYAERAGAIQPGPRAVSWRSDEPATLVWAEAQSGELSAGDRLWSLSAPFTSDPTLRGDVPGRYVRTYWGSENLAVLATRDLTRTGETEIPFDPSRPTWFRAGAAEVPDMLSGGERFVVRPNARGFDSLTLDGDGRVVILNPGQASDSGRIERLSPETGARQLVRELAREGHQTVMEVLDPQGQALVWRETRSSPPNLFFLPRSGAAKQLTAFADPAPEFADVRSVPLRYRRADAVPLSATLYLPPSAKDARPHPLAAVFWAYPVMRDEAPAERGDPTTSQRYVRPTGVDPLLLALSGYAVVVAAMPVVEGEDQASFVEQIVANAAAAIDAAAQTGWVDRERVAAAGHSFGAGMVANLLAGSDLFASGIALSGAYNRTLTPFGFQTERRNLWEAKDEYLASSPLLFADAIDEPLLLVHGAADPNSGATPMQSERMFAALRGLGKPARLVMLPYEGHQYLARESVLHTLWEMEEWLSKTIGFVSEGGKQ